MTNNSSEEKIALEKGIGAKKKQIPAGDQQQNDIHPDNTGQDTRLVQNFLVRRVRGADQPVYPV
jgi:hypothetical protein